MYTNYALRLFTNIQLTYTVLKQKHARRSNQNTRVTRNAKLFIIKDDRRQNIASRSKLSYNIATRDGGRVAKTMSQLLYKCSPRWWTGRQNIVCLPGRTCRTLFKKF